MLDPKFKFYKLMELNREKYDAMVKQVLSPKKEQKQQKTFKPMFT